MDDQIRLTYLPRHYYELQSLRFAPFWIASLACLIYNSLPGHWVARGPAGRVLPDLGVYAVEILWYWLTMRYYRWRIGQMEVEQNIISIGFPWWLIWFTMDMSSTKPWSHVPWSWTSNPWLRAIWIVVLLLLPLIDTKNPLARRVAYLLASAAVAFVTVLSVVYGWDTRPFIATTCLTALALGVADHMLLMTLRAPVREEANA